MSHDHLRRPVSAALSLALALLALVLPAAPAAAAPTSLNVALSIGNSPAWGDQLEVTMSTNYPALDGVLILSRAEPDGSLTPLLSTDTEGKATLDTDPWLPPGTHQLVATAIKDGVEKTSAQRTATVLARPTTVTFLDGSAAADGTIRVRVTSAGDYVPTGTVVFSAPGSPGAVVATDAGGVASWSHPPIGTYTMTAYFQGNSHYAPSSGSTSVTVERYRSSVYGELSRQVIAAGELVSLELEVSTGSAIHSHSLAGGWQLYAKPAITTERVPVAGGTYNGAGTTAVVDLTEWAATREGAWTFQVEYAGNQHIAPASNYEVGTLTIGPADSRPATSTMIDVPPAGIAQGGELTARVTTDGGTPVSGTVILFTGGPTQVTSATAVDGVARLPLPGSIGPGVHQLWAVYGGDANHRGSTSPTVRVTVLAPTGGPGPGEPTPGTPGPAPSAPGTPAAKVASSLRTTVATRRRKPVLTIEVLSTAPTTGAVEVRRGSRLLGTVTVEGGRARLVLKRLRKGKHRLTVTYLGSTAVAGSQRTVAVRVR